MTTFPAPMLAKSVTAVPDPESYPGGVSYEPKWDGFRALISWDGTQVEIGSRGAKPLTRYFPEIVAACAELLPEPCLLDGELVVAAGEPGAQRLSWEALSQRIHPAQSRVTKLSVESPATFVAFDALRRGDRDLLPLPFHERRSELASLVGALPPPIYLTRYTLDRAVAERWLAQFEGAGLDGIVAKPLDDPYRPGARAMLKVKHARTADVVVIGYRVHKNGDGVGSVLVGLYDDAGELHSVGGISAWTNAKRRELIDELAPLVIRTEEGEAASAVGETSRFRSSADASYVPLRPERVVEVRYDQLEGRRFRHTVQFARWRPDRDPLSCRYDQLETVAGYDLGEVLE